VLPSRFEGYPNALLEALAQGLPVLATACPGGTVEILGNGDYGKLVPPDDVPAMTEALDTLLSNQHLRDAYASNARRAVIGLDVATVAKRWLDVMTGLTS
jgi:GalNAc-alpha-(1->4)-GalNAc-alpha-(1->3)-diNAcBac-PP-undecaprenol alpha-1,4-N-acetyl-D-galactosaminyltransferase